jgi:hypothetical protein
MTTSISTDFAVDCLKHFFQNAAIAHMGDAAGVLASSTAGSIFVSLHTALPSGKQNSNEYADSGYARQAVARSSAGWTLTSTPDGNGEVFMVNAGVILFPAVVATPGIITHASVGLQVSGATERKYSVALASPVALVVGDPFEFAAGQLKIAIAVDDA